MLTNVTFTLKKMSLVCVTLLKKKVLSFRMLSVVQLLRFLGAVAVHLAVGLGLLRVVQVAIPSVPDDEKRDDRDDGDGHEAADDDGDERRVLAAGGDALDGAVVARLVRADDRRPLVRARVLDSAPDDAQRSRRPLEREDDVVSVDVGGLESLGDVVHASVGAVAELVLDDGAALVRCRRLELQGDVVILVA